MDVGPATDREALGRLREALTAHGVATRIVEATGPDGTRPRLAVFEPGLDPERAAPADTVVHRVAGELLPGRAGTAQVATFVWGPALEYGTRAEWPLAAAASVAQSFGHDRAQLPRPIFQPSSMRWHRFGRRPLDRTRRDDRPWRLTATFLLKATRLGVEPWQATRTFDSELVGTVEQTARGVWRGRCQLCPAAPVGVTRRDAGHALCAHYLTHVTVKEERCLA
jgi:hypothetical protein